MAKVIMNYDASNVIVGSWIGIVFVERINKKPSLKNWYNGKITSVKPETCKGERGFEIHVDYPDDDGPFCIYPIDYLGSNVFKATIWCMDPEPWIIHSLPHGGQVPHLPALRAPKRPLQPTLRDPKKSQYAAHDEEPCEGDDPCNTAQCGDEMRDDDPCDEDDKPYDDPCDPSSVAKAMMAKMDKMLETINKQQSTIDELTKRFDHGYTTQHTERISGMFTSADIEMFDKLPALDKTKYYGGTKWQGISIGREKICASYKIIENQYKCKSIDTNKDGMKVSKEANSVSWRWYKEPCVLEMQTKDVLKYLKDRSVCSKCKEQVFGYPTKTHNIKSRTKLCFVCKKKEFLAGHKTCTDCSNLRSGAKRGNILRECLCMLEAMFPEMKITLNTNVTESNASGSNRTPDFLMTGINKTSGIPYTFYVFIERDQGQHKGSGYTTASEIEKAIFHVADKLKANDTAKVFFIRYGPEGPVKDKHGNKTCESLSEVERLVILRSWVIWYIMESKKTDMTRLVVLYLWYDDDKRAELFENKMPSFGMATMAPKPKIDAQEHIYACEITEIDHTIYDKCKMFIPWCEDSEDNHDFVFKSIKNYKNYKKDFSVGLRFALNS
jgi:hypothetical protein